MRKCNIEQKALAIETLHDGDVSFQMDAIMARLNAIGEDPLRQMEAQQLRRAYTAAVVRYFDRRRLAERQGMREKAGETRSRLIDD